MDYLNTDCKKYILSFLDLKDYKICIFVNKEFKNIIVNEYFFKNYVKIHFDPFLKYRIDEIIKITYPLNEQQFDNDEIINDSFKIEGNYFEIEFNFYKIEQEIFFSDGTIESYREDFEVVLDVTFKNYDKNILLKKEVVNKYLEAIIQYYQQFKEKYHKDEYDYFVLFFPSQIEIMDEEEFHTIEQLKESFFSMYSRHHLIE